MSSKSVVFFKFLLFWRGGGELQLGSHFTPPPPAGVPKPSSHTTRRKTTSAVDRALLCNAFQFYDGTSCFPADTSLHNRNSAEFAFLRGYLHIVFGPVMTDYTQIRPVFQKL